MIEISHMTDEWIDDGQYCRQDIINLRDELIAWRNIAADLASVLDYGNGDSYHLKGDATLTKAYAKMRDDVLKRFNSA